VGDSSYRYRGIADRHRLDQHAKEDRDETLGN
jgi:hypothetical protein